MKRLLRKYRNVPFITAGLVGINVLVYLVCLFTGERLYILGESGVYGVIDCKEYGRLVWSMFLHVDVEHLANNMLILFFLGGMIEQEIGHISYTIVYFLSGIGGNIVSLAVKFMQDNYVPSVGASGAVFGLDGVLLAMALFSDSFRNQMDPRRVVLVVALSLFSGFRSSNIDNAAHVGGLVLGFAAGSILCAVGRLRKKKI